MIHDNYWMMTGDKGWWMCVSGEWVATQITQTNDLTCEKCLHCSPHCFILNVTAAKQSHSAMCADCSHT